MNNKKKFWEIKQNNEEEVLNIYIYSDVEEDSYDFFGGVNRSNTSANYFKEELSARQDVKQINIYINSRGGSVVEGTAIYNQLKRNPAHKTVYIDGFACSVASVIAMAGDEIIMPKNTMMMIHNMWMAAIGNPKELRKAADDLEKINEVGRRAYLSKAGDKLDYDKIVSMMDEETWLTAEECINYGLADRYADYDADMTDAMQELKNADLNLMQRIKCHKELALQMRQVMSEEYINFKQMQEQKPEEQMNRVEVQEEHKTNKILQLFSMKGEKNEI